jgi:hypothetical protein
VVTEMEVAVAAMEMAEVEVMETAMIETVETV